MAKPKGLDIIDSRIEELELERDGILKRMKACERDINRIEERVQELALIREALEAPKADA